jgi:hypothetical protein
MLENCDEGVQVDFGEGMLRLVALYCAASPGTGARRGDCGDEPWLGAPLLFSAILAVLVRGRVAPSALKTDVAE